MSWQVILGLASLVVSIVVAWVVHRKSKPERTVLEMEAGEKFVLMQDTVIDNLNDEIARLNGKVTALEAEASAVAHVYTRIAALEKALADKEGELVSLRRRVQSLEEENRRLKGAT